MPTVEKKSGYTHHNSVSTQACRWPSVAIGLLLLVSLLATVKTIAQKINTADILKNYSGHYYVYLNRTLGTTIQEEKGSLSIVTHHNEKIMLTKEGVNSMRSKQLLTTSFINIQHLKAWLWVYNGKGYKKEALKDITLKSENDGDVFYDGDQYYTINFLNARQGDIVELDYDEVYKDAHFFGIINFSSYSPTFSYNYSLSYPGNKISVKLKEVNNQRLTLKHNKDSTSRKIDLNWACDSIEALTEEYLDVSYRRKATSLLIGIEKYKSGDSLVTVCGSAANLYKWYQQLLANVDLSSNDMLTKLTDSLTRNKSNNLEKLRAIYYWVQGKIAYIAYEDGLGGYVPRESALVCSRRFGDCKDMANLIVRMSKLAGLPVYHAWIGTRDIPYNFSDFPAAHCANHMIAAYIHQADTIYLDATGKNYPFMLPTSMIQGKEALIGIDKNNFVLAKVPGVPPQQTHDIDSVVLTLGPNNKLTGEGVYVATGYLKIRVLNNLEKKNYTEQMKYLRSLLEKGNNKFKLDTFAILKSDIEQPFRLKYKFTLSDYLTYDGKTNYVNLNFMTGYFESIALSRRKYPLDFNYCFTNRLSVTLHVPQNQALEYLPENTSQKSTLGGYEILYSSQDSKVHLKTNIYLNKINLEPENFEEFGKIMSSFKVHSTNLISFKSKK